MYRIKYQKWVDGEYLGEAFSPYAWQTKEKAEEVAKATYFDRLNFRDEKITLKWAIIKEN